MVLGRSIPLKPGQGNEEADCGGASQQDGENGEDVKVAAGRIVDPADIDRSGQVDRQGEKHNGSNNGTKGPAAKIVGQHGQEGG